LECCRPERRLRPGSLAELHEVEFEAEINRDVPVSSN
jgi:hypothetical protein